jgi:hypothetical protein
MWKAARDAAPKSGSAPAAPSLAAPANAGGPGPASGPAPNAGGPGPQNGPAPAGGGAAGGTASVTTPPPVPPETPDRFRQAKAAAVPSGYTPPKVPEECPLDGHGKLTQVQLDWDSGSSSASRLSRSGQYCFVVQGVNNVLYNWSFALNVPAITSTPLDLLTDAIQTLSKLAIGSSSATTAAAKTAAAKPLLPGETPPPACTPSLDDVTTKSAALKQALAALVPAKDNSGKIAYVPLPSTAAAWAPVPDAFNAFEQAVRTLIANLPADDSNKACADIYAQAEAIVIDNYPALRKQYLDLWARANSKHVAPYEASLENTLPADLVVTPDYNGQATTAGSKTFHFEPNFGILSSSAGFLLTTLAARSYSSATAPNPANGAMTQNVLKVDYGAGVRPALVVLLTGNVPSLNTRNWGIGVSGGPVFDISNGKADTSHFGFFGGLSLRLTPWIYLTPGVHVGEFADFPQGFTYSGQVIPANTGTPTPTKRYTARFAFSLTFKLKDLGSSTSNNQSNGANTASKTGQPAGGASPK